MIQNIQGIPQQVCRDLKVIFCDIDDTLTTHGKLLKSSYDALWKAKESGLAIVPITGRPAGWADHIARMWPVDAVVGENGAFYFWMAQNRMNRVFVQDDDTRKLNQQKLKQLEAIILEAVPKAKVSADQKYRESDLAIDFCEDIPALESHEIDKIVALFKEAGAVAKVSSIHVNGWFGEFDKFTTCKQATEDIWGEFSVENYIYCGDSPNDEPMFAQFKYSVGVANVAPWLPQMKSHPTFITTAEGGDGFAEFVDIVLQKRGK